MLLLSCVIMIYVFFFLDLTIFQDRLSKQRRTGGDKFAVTVEALPDPETDAPPASASAINPEVRSLTTAILTIIPNFLSLSDYILSDYFSCYLLTLTRLKTWVMVRIS